MRDLVISAMRQLAATWQQDVEQRRRVSSIDPVADATAFRASELLSELERVDEATRLLTVEQYARERGLIASTVRRWCLRGELEAERNDKGDWEIPRVARRTQRRKLA